MATHANESEDFSLYLSGLTGTWLPLFSATTLRLARSHTLTHAHAHAQTLHSPPFPSSVIARPKTSTGTERAGIDALGVSRIEHLRYLTHVQMDSLELKPDNRQELADLWAKVDQQASSATYDDLVLSLNSVEQGKLCTEHGVTAHAHLRFLRAKQIRAMNLRPVPKAIMDALMQQLEAEMTAEEPSSLPSYGDVRRVVNEDGNAY